MQGIVHELKEAQTAIDNLTTHSSDLSIKSENCLALVSNAWRETSLDTWIFQNLRYYLKLISFEDRLV